MNVGEKLSRILQSEGVDLLFCYPTNRLIDEVAKLGIRPIVVRQERTGIHMADAYSRLSSGRKIGVFVMQHGPGAENSYGGVAQAFADSVPVMIIPQGYPQRLAGIRPNYSSAISMRDITKFAEALSVPGEIGNLMRRAFSEVRNGRGGPVLVEIPNDLWDAQIPEQDYSPVQGSLFGPDPAAIRAAVKLLKSARAPVIYAGQGVHYAQAWPQLRQLAETMGIPVATSLPGKSSFPEDHPLSLGSGGLTYPRAVKQYLDQADVVLGIGCSFTETGFAVPMPKTPRIIHATIDPSHLNKDVKADIGLVGDAGLTLDAILAELQAVGHEPAEWSGVAAEIKTVRDAWLAEWMPHLTDNAQPLSPYRVLWELMKATEAIDTIITNDAGRPRDQLTPFWVSRKPLSFIGWGKTTQLGYGLGLAMGAKLACPDKLCINVWGDAAIGFTGMDFETAAREKIPILSILLNNQGMATELNNVPNAIERFRATDITGHYADMATAFGGYGERISRPEEILPAIQRGIAKTDEGVPALLEFMTRQETAMSR